MRIIAFLSFAFFLVFLFLYTIASTVQDQYNKLYDIKNVVNFIEVFEYEQHEYLRYKVNNQVGGICHKQNCKFCENQK